MIAPWKRSYRQRKTKQARETKSRCATVIAVSQPFLQTHQDLEEEEEGLVAVEDQRADVVLRPVAVLRVARCDGRENDDVVLG